MGTPEFSVPPLIKLIEAHTVAAVVTQPDKPAGRGNAAAFQAVKKTALERGIPVMQPEKMRDKAFLNELRELDVDIFVVAAYGKILPETVLNMPKYGAVCVHASLLPRWRGASPIQQAIISGDSVTGVTIMRMDKGIDTGDIVLQEKIDIDEDETGGTLHDKLSELGAELILKALGLIENGSAVYEKQDGFASSYAPIINKEDGRVDWNMPAVKIERLIRGLNPWPSAYTYTDDGSMIKIWEAALAEGVCGECGEIISAAPDGIIVACGDGAVIIKELQRAGGKRMKAAEFLRGRNIKVRQRL